MMNRSQATSRPVLTAAVVVLLCTVTPAKALPTPAATSDFNAYAARVEARLQQQHRSAGSFLQVGSSRLRESRLRSGEVEVEDLSPAPSSEPAGALIHHWRASAFAPGATAAQFERLMRDFGAYPRYFAPDVVSARVISAHENEAQAFLRVRQRHVLTVVLDATYDVSFGQLDPQHRFSVSRSRSISEMDVSSTGAERALTADEEHGFLWRQNTYWSCEEKDGGVYLQVESVSLTRSIPRGLGWVIGPYVQSIPRESLEFTLRSAVSALRRSTQGKEGK